MHPRHDLLNTALALASGPLGGRASIQRSSIEVEFHMREVLQQTDEEERHFVVCKLFNEPTM